MKVSNELAARRGRASAAARIRYGTVRHFEMLTVAMPLYESGMSWSEIAREVAGRGIVHPKTGRPYTATNLREKILARQYATKYPSLYRK